MKNNLFIEQLARILIEQAKLSVNQSTFSSNKESDPKENVSINDKNLTRGGGNLQ